MRTLIHFCALIFTGFLFGCAAPDQRLPYHFSGDFQTQVLYLSDSVAIEKHLNIYPDGSTKTFYMLGRAHREDSQSAANTGDRFDESVKGNVKRVGASAGGHWLLVESDDYDLRAQKAIIRVTAVALTSGQMYSATDTASFPKLVRANIASARLEPVELFFDRSVILRFHNRLE